MKKQLKNALSCKKKLSLAKGSPTFLAAGSESAASFLKFYPKSA
ncbi:hypothetical protein [Patiriisocius sp. Uisw_017]